MREFLSNIRASFLWSFDYWYTVFFIVGSIFGITALSMLLARFQEKIEHRNWSRKNSPIRHTRVGKDIRKMRGLDD